MRRLLRTFLASYLALWVTPQLIGGFKIVGDWQTYLLGGAVLTFIYIFVKPILKLFLLPINFLSLGLFSWVVNVILLYLLAMVVPQIQVTAWQFSGISYQGLVIPAYNLNQIAVFIIASFIISAIINFLNWLTK